MSEPIDSEATRLQNRIEILEVSAAKSAVEMTSSIYTLEEMRVDLTLLGNGEEGEEIDIVAYELAEKGANAAHKNKAAAVSYYAHLRNRYGV